MAVVPIAAADPSDDESLAPASEQPLVAVADTMPPDANVAVAQACKDFGAALDYAASNYEDFAYNSAGNGNTVNYQDPIVQNSNVIGRTALREAASVAMRGATTPGLPPEVSAPMQSWSLRATKLLLIMGLHGGGDSLNSTANDMNTDAHNAQLACAANGGRA